MHQGVLCPEWMEEPYWRCIGTVGTLPLEKAKDFHCETLQAGYYYGKVEFTILL